MNTDEPEDAVDATERRVLKIQTKLHRWARDDPHRRFDDLFNLVADPGFLLVAWDRVQGNKGARTAGVDGRTARSVAAGHGVEVPTVADRVVQASLKLVLEPIFEADFLPCSYGFRPKRRAHDAVAEVHYLASKPRNYEWIVEGDITACFDEISHPALMARVRARVADKTRPGSGEGVPQGGDPR